MELNAVPVGAPASAVFQHEDIPERISSTELRKRITQSAKADAQVFNYLKDGLLRCFASKAYFAAFRYDEDKAWRHPKEVISHARLHGVAGPWNGWIKIEASFWERAHLQDLQKWDGVTYGPMNATFSDWRGDEFGSIHLAAEWVEGSDGPDLVDYVVLAQFYGVCFAANDVEALLPHIVPTLPDPIASRSSRYNWEGAISAFCAAQWKHDIVPDVHAHGAAAAIGQWLTDWFSPSGNIPSETAIKGRARLILEDMKKADKA